MGKNVMNNNVGVATGGGITDLQKAAELVIEYGSPRCKVNRLLTRTFLNLNNKMK